MFLCACTLIHMHICEYAHVHQLPWQCPSNNCLHHHRESETANYRVYVVFFSTPAPRPMASTPKRTRAVEALLAPVSEKERCSVELLHWSRWGRRSATYACKVPLASRAPRPFFARLVVRFGSQLQRRGTSPDTFVSARTQQQAQEREREIVKKDPLASA